MNNPLRSKITAGFAAALAVAAIGAASSLALVGNGDQTNSSVAPTSNVRILDELLRNDQAGEDPLSAPQGTPAPVSNGEVPDGAEISLKSSGNTGFRTSGVDCLNENMSVSVTMTPNARFEIGNTINVGGDQQLAATRIHFFGWNGSAWVEISASNWYQTTINSESARWGYPVSTWLNLGTGQWEGFPFQTNFTGYVSAAIEYYWYADANHNSGYAYEWATQHVDYDSNLSGYCAN